MVKFITTMTPKWTGLTPIDAAIGASSGVNMSAVATGARSGVPMPLSAGTLASFSAAVAGGAGDGDLADLAKFVREKMVQNFE